MEAYYVINNKIPQFYLQSDGSAESSFQQQVAKVYQIWIKEKIISNLKRRKVNFIFFQLAKFLKGERIPLEKAQRKDFQGWVKANHPALEFDFFEFLVYARNKIPELNWEELLFEEK